MGPEFIEALRTKTKKKIKLDSWDAGGMFFHLKLKEKQETLYCIWFDADNWREEVVWHEALHATTRILKDRGITLSVKNDEMMCYLQGYIATNIRAKMID